MHQQLLAQFVMPTLFPSKAFSCSDLIAGAAVVADQMQGVPTDLAVVNYKRELLSETDGLDIGELEKLLQDCLCLTILVDLEYIQTITQHSKRWISILGACRTRRWKWTTMHAQVNEMLWNVGFM